MFLKERRNTQPTSATAQSSNVTVAEIEEIERGNIHINLGHFRHIIKHGYDCSLEDVLAACFAEHEKQFLKINYRDFERHCDYRLCRRKRDGEQQTPLLVGGHPKKFLWAAPLRRLLGQPLVTEFLELAPHRQNSKNDGAIAENNHEGVEVITVLHGSINAHFYHMKEPIKRIVNNGDSIHFCAHYPHKIVNAKTTSSALVHIVRLP